MENSLLEKAIRIALIAHKNQRRKTEPIPFVTHPIMVALTLAKHGFTDVVIAAALVHDVLEDTTYSEKKLGKELGKEVLLIVKAVTKDQTLSGKKQHAKYIETIMKGPEGAKALVCADKIHNLETLLVVSHMRGSEPWTHFDTSRETRALFEKDLLTMLRKNWKHRLLDEYSRLIENSQDKK